MINLDKTVKFLDDYLEINSFDDICWNGLQIEGNQEIKKIAFAVYACKDVFQEAVNRKSDLIITHHGLFWKPDNPSLTKHYKEKSDILLKNNTSLYAAHLPLDCHKKVGNNAQLLKLLGAKRTGEFYKMGNNCIGLTGKLEQATPRDQIQYALNSKLSTNCIILPFGKKNIETIAVCSGGGTYETFFEALNKKVDMYLTGDACDIKVYAKDAKFNVIFAGHYATETVGVLALEKIIKNKFKVDTTFIDMPTGL